MDVEGYVAARRRLLIEHARELGVDEESAPGVVDAVVERQRRRIQRADDPHPWVVDALEREVRGPSPHRRTTVLGAAALVVLLAAGYLGHELLEPAPRVRVPSTFALDAAEATALLHRGGVEVRASYLPTCEPPGLVVGSKPVSGTSVESGSTVELRVAGGPGPFCQATPDRTAAWAFLDFVRGGPAPRFDDTVYVVLDGREPAVLPRAAAVDPRRWAGIEAVRRTVTRQTGPLQLTTSTGLPPPEQCGTPRPAAAGDRETLRLQVEPGRGPTPPCPLTVDLYRDTAGVIDAVVVYSPGPG